MRDPCFKLHFFRDVDKAVNNKLQKGVTIFTYVDCYLILIQSCHVVQRSEYIENVFKEEGMIIEFTCEMPRDDRLHFLNVHLNFNAEHLYWQYSPCSVKPILDIASANEKLMYIIKEKHGPSPPVTNEETRNMAAITSIRKIPHR